MSEASVLKVQGEGLVAVAPELIVLKITVTNREKEYAAAIAGLNSKTEQVRRAIEGAGLKRDDLKTTDFGVTSDYKQDKEYNRTLIGFVAQHYLHISMPIDKQLANSVFRTLAGSGTGAEFHVRFDVKDRNEVKNRAIAAAVENAKARATVLAEAAGVSVGRILNISYGFEEVRISSDVEFQLSAPEAPDFDGPDLDAQDLIAKDHVTITWAIG